MSLPEVICGFWVSNHFSVQFFPLEKITRNDAIVQYIYVSSSERINCHFLKIFSKNHSK